MLTVSGAQAYGTGTMGSVGGGNGGTGKKRRLLLPIVVVVLVLLLAGGYVFGFYLPNQPQNVFNSSLKNSGAALDKLTSYAQDQSKAKYASASLDGTLKYSSADVSFDADMKGAFDKDSNGTLQVNADVAGEKFTGNFRSIKASGNTSPDVYFQVTGIKPLLDSAGVSEFDDLDGQWVAVDHTLIDTYASSLSQEVDGTSTNATDTPTADQVNDAVQAIENVNRQYIFTSDKDKAVLQYQSFKGKETMDGRSVNHYVAGYSKDHLQSYVSALKTALDGSKLNDWSKQANKKSLSEVLDVSDLQDSIKNAKSDYTFDVWADTKQKVIHAVQFTDPNNKSDVFKLTQNYTGGDNYPFSFYVTSKDSGDTTTATLTATVNTSSNKVTVGADVSDKSSVSGTSSFKMNLTVVPSKESVKVTAPSGSKPVAEILNELGLGGLDSSNLSEGSVSQGSDLFTLSQ